MPRRLVLLLSYLLSSVCIFGNLPTRRPRLHSKLKMFGTRRLQKCNRGSSVHAILAEANGNRNMHLSKSTYRHTVLV